MKIALIAGQFPARSETFIVQHALGLARRGHQVTVFAQSCGPDISDDEVESCNKYVEIVRAKPNRTTKPGRLFGIIGDILKKKLSFTQQLKGIGVLFKLGLPGRLMTLNHFMPIIGQSFDIVHVHYGMFAIPIFLFKDAGLLDGEVVVTWHGVDANYYPHRYGDDLYKDLFSRKALHTVGSSFMRQRVHDLGASNLDIHLIPMGIDLDFFSGNCREYKRGSLLRVVSVGRLTEMKGQAHLVRAVVDLLKQGENIGLTIIGEGLERRVIEEIISRYDLKKRIYLLGAQNSSKIRAVMRKSHLFALTGVQATDGFVETQGIVFAEAQATGLPVIGSRIGGVPDSLEEHKTGLLCEPGNVSQIKDAIGFFINKPSAIREFGVAGRKFVEKTFPAELMLDKFEQIYNAQSAWKTTKF